VCTWLRPDPALREIAASALHGIIGYSSLGMSLHWSRRREAKDLRGRQHWQQSSRFGGGGGNDMWEFTMFKLHNNNSPMCLKAKGICSVTSGLISELVMTRSLNLQKKKTIDLDYIAFEITDCPSVAELIYIRLA
jgi:hypothetical protein